MCSRILNFMSWVAPDNIIQFSFFIQFNVKSKTTCACIHYNLDCNKHHGNIKKSKSILAKAKMADGKWVQPTSLPL